MKTVEEIRDYLNIGRDVVSERLIKDAQSVEDKYGDKLLDGNYGYAIEADFVNTPFILEDEDEVKDIIKVEQIGGIVVYKKIIK